MTKFSFFFLTLVAFVAPALAVDGTCICNIKFNETLSRDRIKTLLPAGELFLIEGKLLTEGECAGKADYVYHFVDLTAQKSGYVKLVNDSNCEAQETVALDAEAGGMGFYLLKNLDDVWMGASDAAKKAKKAKAGFEWNSEFQIFQPLHPDFKQPNYVLGSAKGSESVVINAKTGKLVED